MSFRFQLTDLLNLTVYLAVTARLVSLNQPHLIPLWLGTVLGLESGKRSEYPTFLITICGTVCGLAFAMALLGTLSAFQPSPAIPMGGKALSWLTIIAWLTFISIFLWIVFRVRRSTAPGNEVEKTKKPTGEN